MIKMMPLILESKASEEAKKQGLFHKGGAYYATTKGGPATHRSAGDKLVKVGQKQQKAKKPKKQTETTVNQSKKIWQNTQKWVNHYAAGLYGGQEGFARAVKGFESLLRENPHNGETVNYYSDPEDTGPESYKSREKYVYLSKHDSAFVAKSIVKYKEQAKKYGKIDAMEGYSGQDSAVEQHANWRGKLPIDTQAEFSTYVLRWQTAGQYDEPPVPRTERNRFLTGVIGNEKDPAMVHFADTVEDPMLSRGMRVGWGDAEEFLSNFKVGEEVVMTPSGFSTRQQMGHKFSGTNSKIQFSVILKIRPAKGKREMVGLHISHMTKSKKLGEKSSYLEVFTEAAHDKYGDDLNDWPPKVVKAYRRLETGLNVSYDDEIEVIRPGNVKQRVTKIEKHVFNNAPDDYTMDKNYMPEPPKIWYVIEMEDAGFVEDESMIQEKKSTSKKQSKAKQILKRYMNTSVHLTKPKPKKKK